MKRRTSLWLAVGSLALSASACAPKTTPVFVDIQSALAHTEVKAPSRPTVPSPPNAQPGFSTVLPGQPATGVKDNPQASGPGIRERIRAAQLQAQKDITARLRKFYETEVERFELEQRKALSEAEVKAYEEANKRIRAQFEEYAQRRMPVFTELTLLAGFPDPNPTSRQPDGDMTPVMKRRFDKTVELRKELEQIDEDFHLAVQQIFSGVQDITSANLAAMTLRVEQFKEALDRRAAEEANLQVRDTAKELGLTLIEPLKITLPATEAHKVSVPPEPPLQPAPQLPTAGIFTGAKDRERLLRHELNIWLGLNRYTLAATSNGVSDKTNEFLEWREKYQIGR